MRIKKIFLTLLSATLVLGGFFGVANAKEIKIVTSFSILESIAKEIGGDKVSTYSLIPRKSSAHSFAAKPQDLAKIKAADIFAVSGLELEAGVDKILSATKFNKKFVVASTGIEGIKFDGDCGHDHGHDHGHEGHHHHHGDIDPHIWQSPVTGKIYAKNLFDAYVEVDSKNKSYYQANLDKFNEAMNRLDLKLKNGLKSIPESQRVIVTAHQAFNYMGRDYGIKTLGIQGIDNLEGVSARDIANTIKYIKKNNVKGIFFEADTDKRLVTQILKHTKVKVGGVLYAGTLSDMGGVADTYIKMLEYNIDLILKALK